MGLLSVCSFQPELFMFDTHASQQCYSQLCIECSVHSGRAFLCVYLTRWELWNGWGVEKETGREHKEARWEAYQE